MDGKKEGRKGRRKEGRQASRDVGKGSRHRYILLSRITSLLKAFIDLALPVLKVHMLFAFSLLILLKYDSSKRNRKPRVTFTELCVSIRSINLRAISTVLAVPRPNRLSCGEIHGRAQHIFKHRVRYKTIKVETEGRGGCLLQRYRK